MMIMNCPLLQARVQRSYFVQKSLSSSPARDDEGYSGSSDVSENHLPVETPILSVNQLLEQYRIHEFRTRQSISPLSYDIFQSKQYQHVFHRMYHLYNLCVCVDFFKY